MAEFVQTQHSSGWCEGIYWLQGNLFLLLVGLTVCTQASCVHRSLLTLMQASFHACSLDAKPAAKLAAAKHAACTRLLLTLVFVLPRASSCADHRAQIILDTVAFSQTRESSSSTHSLTAFRLLSSILKQCRVWALGHRWLSLQHRMCSLLEGQFYVRD